MLVENVELSHLAKSMGLPVSELLEVARNPGLWFNPPFRKRIGKKKRDIDPPTKPGKRWLKRLADFIACELPVHPCAHGSVRHHCNHTAARSHLGGREISTRDAKDCFPSVSPSHFFNEMLLLGFRHDVAVVLTKLLLYRGRLPQGSPASNAALNLFFYRTDEAIRTAVMAFGARYTRYCDDLVVSVVRAEDTVKAGPVLEEALAALGLSVNVEKRERNGHQALDVERHVNGIRVDTGVTELPSTMVADILSKATRYEISARSCNLDALLTLAKRRRSLDGLYHYARRVDTFPLEPVRRLLHAGDISISRNLRKHGVTLDHRNWWRKNQYFDAAKVVKFHRPVRSGLIPARGFARPDSTSPSGSSDAVLIAK